MSDQPKHLMNNDQMLSAVFDFNKRSIKVHQDDVSHELILSAASDSIVSVPTFIVVPQGQQEMCGMYKRASIFSSGPCTLAISPKDGIAPMPYVSFDTPVTMHIIDICCSSILLTGPADAVLVLQG